MKKKAIVILIVVCIFLWVLSAYALITYFGIPDNAGAFGDMFGAVNALFSGLALAFVIYAVFLQLEELEVQREELKNSRKELATQNEIIAAQLKSMRESSDFERKKEQLASEPFFISDGGTYTVGIGKKVKIKNDGETVSNVKISFLPEIRPIIEIERWKTQVTHTIDFEWSKYPENDITICIDFTDRLHYPGTRKFIVPKNKCDLVHIE